MKKIFTLLFCLIFSTKIYAQNGCASLAGDPVLQEQKKQCDADNSKRWDCQLNTCVITEENIESRDEYNKCAALDSAESRKTCFDKLAKDRAGSLKTKDPDSGANKSLQSMVSGVALTMAIINYSGKGVDGCTSGKIFSAAAIASLLSELYTYFSLSKKLKKLESSYKKTAIEDPYSAQLKAFEFLKKQQETIAKNAKTKKTAYTIQLAMYAAATTTALLEMTSTFGMQPCAAAETPKDTPAKKPAPKAQPGQIFIKNFNIENEINKFVSIPSLFNPKIIFTNAIDTLFPKTFAASGKNQLWKYLIGAGGGAIAATALEGTGYENMFQSSAGIAAVSGISTVLTTTLRSAAAKQQKQASENADHVQKIIDEFKQTMGAYCPEGREDLNNARCYCYKDDGTQNLGRSNSETCQNLFASEGQNFFVGASDYSAKRDPNTKCCLTISRQLDCDCKCKKFKTQGGANACYKQSLSGFNIDGGLGSNLGLEPLFNEVNAQASGSSVGASGLNLNAANNLAARNLKIADQTLKQVNKKRNSSGLSNVNLNSARLADKLVKKASSPANLAAISKGALNPNSFSAPSIKDKNLSSALSKTGLLNTLVEKSGSVASSKKSKKKNSFKLNFGNDGSSGQNVIDAKFMDKNYDYKENDIVKREDISIWKIISTRYNNTGLRRLFE